MSNSAETVFDKKTTNKPSAGQRNYRERVEPPISYSDRARTQPVPVSPAVPIMPLYQSAQAFSPAAILPPAREAEEEFSNPPAVLGGERPLILHNDLGPTYSIKLVYPGFYLSMRPNEILTTVGFTPQKEKLAKKVTPGHLFFVYITSPERRIIGLGMATSHPSFEPERDYRHPWVFDLVWVISPKTPGVTFAEIELEVKPRVGDSTYAITDDVAEVIIERLKGMDTLEKAELTRLQERYRLLG